MPQNKKINITDWDVSDRPREKLMLNGKNILSNSELIAILIGSGNREETAVELSKRILNHVDNSLNRLGELSINELQAFNGIGEAKAISIIAALELGRRRKNEDKEILTPITSSRDAFLQNRHLFEELKHEEFWVFYLSRANKIIHKQLISKGGISGTIADIRIIFKVAIEKLASALIVAHNHPSGNKTPSLADKKLTAKIVQTGNIMDIQVLDHLIFTDSDYFSFADEGILPST